MNNNVESFIKMQPLLVWSITVVMLITIFLVSVLVARKITGSITSKKLKCITMLVYLDILGILLFDMHIINAEYIDDVGIVIFSILLPIFSIFGMIGFFLFITVCEDLDKEEEKLYENTQEN